MERSMVGAIAIGALFSFGCGSPEETAQTPAEYAADVQEIQRKAMEESLRIQKEKLMAGAPPPEEWRKQLATRIEEVEALQNRWLRTLEAVQAATPDREQKRYAGNAVTMARMTTKSALKQLRQTLEKAQDIQLRGVDRFVNSQKVQMETEIAKAREKLKTLGGAVSD